ncbi:16S rRNA (uracil(1498)-N(3))-methyltransferase [Marinomonas epiphytica]
MNLILLDPTRVSASGQYWLNERQVTHLAKVVKAKNGDSLRVGELGGKMGEGIFVEACGEVPPHIHKVALHQSPPDPLPITLVMALPRPNMLKRTLHNMTAMGVKEIVLVHSAKVEKSYWQSPVLKPESLRLCLLEGLEQAKDTVLPKLTLVPRFRPFVEDQLPALLKDKLGLLAHPYRAEKCPIDIQEPCVLALGPEGGWNDFEVSKWLEAGMQSVQLGERILKVETVVPVLLSRLYPN